MTLAAPVLGVGVAVTLALGVTLGAGVTVADAVGDALGAVPAAPLGVGALGEAQPLPDVSSR